MSTQWIHLADFDEGVRFAATEAISMRPHDRAGTYLLSALTNPEEESGRLKSRIADVLAQAEMPLGDHKSAIAELLKTDLEGFQLKHDKLRKR